MSTRGIFGRYLIELPAEIRARLDDEMKTVEEQILYTWVYADDAARLAAVHTESNDIGQVAYQLSDQTLWLLVGLPGTWVNINTSAAGAADPVADWDLSLVRYFLVDYDGGSDSNVGYVDAAAGSTITPTGKALKTLTQLTKALPVVGNGRTAVVLIKPRASGVIYKKADGTTDDGLNISHVSGYNRFVVRGSTDLTNTTADRILCGGITAVAHPTNVYWTCGAGCTASVLNVGGSLPAEPAALGYRIRFAADTTTVALRNICEMVHANTSGTLTVSGDLPATPASGDTFYIEKPGVQMSQLILDDITAQGNWNRLAYTDYTPPTGSPFHAVAGILATTGEIRTNTAYAMSFVAVNAGQWMTGSPVNHVATYAYPDETGTIRKTGTGVRLYEVADGNMTLNGVDIVDTTNCCFIRTTAGTITGFLAGMNSVVYIGRSSVFWNMRLGVAVNGGSQDFLIGTRPVEAAAGPRRKMRVAQTGRVLVVGSAFNTVSYSTGGGFNQGIQGVDFDSSLDGIYLYLTGGSINIDDCSGTITGTEPVIRLYAENTRVVIGRRAANTVTAPLGAMLVGFSSPGNPVNVLTFAEIARNGFVDVDGNTVLGYVSATDPYGVLSRNTRFMLNGSGVQLAAGTLVRLSAADTFTVAQANSEANCTNVLGVLLNTTDNGDPGFVAVMGSVAVMKFDIASPTIGKVYLSAATAGVATNTPPSVSGTDQKLRIGYCIRSLGSTYGVVDMHLETMPILSDGNP